LRKVLLKNLVKVIGDEGSESEDEDDAKLDRVGVRGYF
jgi:hypothetical protein